MADKPRGYFIWMRTAKGEPTPQKLDADIMSQAQPESIKRRRQMTLESTPLYEEEWLLPLNVLAERYPLKRKYEEYPDDLD